jgi:hypothetical protein
MTGDRQIIDSPEMRAAWEALRQAESSYLYNLLHRHHHPTEVRPPDTESSLHLSVSA